MTRTPRRGDAAFSLIEVLLALAIMGFITALLWGTFAQTASSKKRVEAAQERTHTVRVALMRMSREVEMAYLSGEPVTTTERRTMFVGTAHNSFDELRFSWFGHQRVRADRPESDTSLVSYYTETDPDDRTVTNLIRRETRRLQVKDPKTIPGESYVLCPNIAGIKFSYYDFLKKEWREEWTTIGSDGRTYLPTQVRISLTVIDERGKSITFTTTARVQTTERVDYRPSKV
jgi:general secretion pathway protein J